MVSRLVLPIGIASLEALLTSGTLDDHVDMCFTMSSHVFLCQHGLPTRGAAPAPVTKVLTHHRVQHVSQL